jgi:hypothetical protein
VVNAEPSPLPNFLVIFNALAVFSALNLDPIVFVKFFVELQALLPNVFVESNARVAENPPKLFDGLF